MTPARRCCEPPQHDGKYTTMSWKKYFRVVDQNGTMSPISGNANRGPNYGQGDGAQFGFRNWQSNLPEVYSGHPNRVERYNQYENMDCDSEVNACLDILAEFSTQTNPANGTPFEVDFTDKPTDHEIKLYASNCNSGAS